MLPIDCVPRRYIKHDDYVEYIIEYVIANNANKAALLNFIAESWVENARSLPQGFKLILGGTLKDPGKAVLLTTTETAVVPELSCLSHEEADTRIFSRLLYAVQRCGYQRAVIQATDSDICTHGNLPPLPSFAVSEWEYLRRRMKPESHYAPRCHLKRLAADKILQCHCRAGESWLADCSKATVQQLQSSGRRTVCIVPWNTTRDDVGRS